MLGHFNVVQYFLHDALRGHFFRFCFVRDGNAVSKNIETDCADVFGYYIPASFDKCMRL